MSASISTLPVWKRGSTPGEWLSEVAGLALENPGRFKRVIVIYEEEERQDAGENYTNVRWAQYGVEKNREVQGLLVTAQLELFEYMKGRRE